MLKNTTATTIVAVGFGAAYLGVKMLASYFNKEEEFEAPSKNVLHGVMDYDEHGHYIAGTLRRS